MSSVAVSSSVAAPAAIRSDSRLARFRRSMLRDRAALLGATILVLIAAVVLLAPIVSPFDPLETNPANRLSPPLRGPHVLGTDELGRDIFSRLAYGGRISLLVAIVPVVLSVAIGGTLGLIAGYFGGWADTVVMRVLDVLLAFPSILLAVGIAAALGPGIANLMVALVVVGIPSIARIVRAAVLQIRELEYVLAARTLGSSHPRILARQIVPNVLAPVIVFSTLETGRKIILAAGLSFLGLGVLPPTPDWGAMLASGRQVMVSAPHVATIPGLLIFVVTLAFNVLGDGLRDALDPRLRNL